MPKVKPSCHFSSSKIFTHSSADSKSGWMNALKNKTVPVNLNSLLTSIGAKEAGVLTGSAHINVLYATVTTYD